MISFAFILCSTLLLSGVIADEVKPDEAPTSAELAKIASTASLKVVNDLMDGKDLQDSIYKHSDDALKKIKNPFASASHSILKRWMEMRGGQSMGDTVGKMFKASNKKMAGKFKTYDDMMKTFGEDDMARMISKMTEMIKSAIMGAIDKRNAAKEAAKAA